MWNWKTLSEYEKHLLEVAELGRFTALKKRQIPARYRNAKLDPIEKEMLRRALEESERRAA